MQLSSYHNKTIVLTTKHQKDVCIAPSFKDILNAKVTNCEVDTDELGTFSKERERQGSAKDCVKIKCLWGMQVAGCSYGIATEGSFGPHPYLPFVPGHHEIMCFHDAEKDFFLFETLFSINTNYKQMKTERESDLWKFSKAIFFPQHGLIIRPNVSESSTILFKGIQDIKTLMDKFKYCREVSLDGLVHVETDMRAYQNPMRQKVIAQLAEKLAKRLLFCCPACQTPGFGIVDVEKGLPCLRCYFATDLAKKEIWGCTRCNFCSEQPRADGLEFVTPKDCSYCNP